MVLDDKNVRRRFRASNYQVNHYFPNRTHVLTLHSPLLE